MTTRLPQDWQPHPEDLARLAAEHACDPLASVPRFRHHFLFGHGRGETSSDWRARFRKWVRDEHTREPDALSPKQGAEHARALLASLDTIPTKGGAE